MHVFEIVRSGGEAAHRSLLDLIAEKFEVRATRHAGRPRVFVPAAHPDEDHHEALGRLESELDALMVNWRDRGYLVTLD